MSAGKDVNCENCTYKDETNSKLPTCGQVEHLLSLDTKDVWLTDSGASKHITYRREWLKEYRPCKGETAHLGDNSTCAVEGIGTVDIEKLINGVWEKGQIRDVMYVPLLRKNLFSVGACT